MRQPKLPEDLDALGDFLDFAVPLRAAGLSADLAGLSPEHATARLQGLCRAAGVSLGSKGDSIQFSDGKPRTGRQQATATRTLDDLATGVAAAAFLAGPDGVTVFGRHFGPRHDVEHLPTSPDAPLQQCGPEDEKEAA